MTIQEDSFTKELLINAGIKEGSRVLDVGCGRGDVTFMISKLVGNSGKVVGIDIDKNSIDIAYEKIKNPNTSNMSYLIGDAQKLPNKVGKFDAIIGRRVLMYQSMPVEFISNLRKHLNRDGVIAFQEHDMTMVPANIYPMPLHRKVQNWLRHTIKAEGADTNIGFILYEIFVKAGLKVEKMKAEPIIQTPTEPYHVAAIVKAILPRILKSNAATKEEIEIETLEDRLTEERLKTNAIYIGDMKFAIWAK